MKIGLSAYDVTARDFLDMARAADEAGFSSLWLGEHIVLPIGYTTDHPSVGGSAPQHHTGPIIDADTELVDPLVQLGAAASTTSRIRLATGIFILPLRHPLAVARSVCTVQELAEGRFDLGIGFGWLKEEYVALGLPFRQRVSRFEEGIDVIRLALRGGAINHDGRHFPVSDIQVTRRPTHVPLMLGGNSPKALERAARLGDGWFSSGTPQFEESIRLREELMELRASGERSADPFRLVFRMEGNEAEVVGRYADAGFEEVLIWADRVWPATGDLGAKREAMFAAADALGLRRSDPYDPAVVPGSSAPRP